MSHTQPRMLRVRRKCRCLCRWRRMDVAARRKQQGSGLRVTKNASALYLKMVQRLIVQAIIGFSSTANGPAAVMQILVMSFSVSRCDRLAARKVGQLVHKTIGRKAKTGQTILAVHFRAVKSIRAGVAVAADSSLSSARRMLTRNVKAASSVLEQTSITMTGAMGTLTRTM